MAPGGIVTIGGETFSVTESIGGVRGLLESVLPVVFFTVVYAVTHELLPSVAAPVAVCLVLIVVRLVTRKPVTPAVSGFLGVLLAAGIAVYTGRAVDFFLVSIVKNVVFAVLYGGSALLGWPLLGVLLGLFLGEGTHWRQVPARRRVYAQATWLWCGMFLVRLAFQIPLFRDEAVEELGVASVPLGLPLYGLVLLLTWLIVRRVPVALPPESEQAGDAAGASRSVAVEPGAVEPDGVSGTVAERR
ncbi:MAG: DUF3159 domain-containing protein [Actinomycetales bacterium]|nr:DUF3159 domain-containing protein [Actinomycetales bacterium]